MNQKLNYMVIATSLTFVNIALIETRFNLIGIGFGFAGIVFWIKSIRVKK